ncbi:MAG: transposase [Candidatus Pacebacteria bacterium]|nr:transposase [Candidatus Paceibacterota bacterium]
MNITAPKDKIRKEVNKPYSKNVLQCRFCGSYKTVKFGFNKVKGERKQRYCCKDCDRTFIPSSKLVKPNTYFNSYSDLGYEKDEYIGKICRLAKKTAYPFLDFNLHYTAKYDTNTFLDLLAHIAIEHDFTQNGAKTFRIDRKKSPIGDTLLYHIKKMKVNSAMENFVKSSEEMFKLAKKSNLFKGRKLDVAIDFHDIAYWGNKNNPMLVRTNKEQGTSFAFRFATITIVERGKRFTLHTLPVSPLDRNGAIVDRLITYAKNIIPIDTVYLDRGFFHSREIDVLKKHNVKFLMVAVRNERVKRLIKENEHGVVIDHTMSKSTTFKLVITEKDGEKRAFATNLNIGIKRRLLSLYDLYGKRWGIETSYRIIDHDFKARTTSKRYVIRLFYFLFCVLLYNLWVLANVLLASWLLKFIPRKLLVTAKYFGKLFVSTKIKDPG